jgi:hypothetical protein
MKRMTLFTSLVLVLSLFTVTAAIAGSGPGVRDGDQSGGVATTQEQTRTNDATCQGDDCPAGDMVRLQDRVQDQVGECQSDDCPTGEPTKAQTQTQAQLKSGECLADDCQADEALMANEQIRERFMNRLLEMLGAETAEVEGQYRLLLNFILQNMLQFRVLFV